MKDLIEFIAKGLVDKPDEVKVTEDEQRGRIIVRLEVAEDDYGKVIGKGGRIAQAMRAMLTVSAVGSDLAPFGLKSELNVQSLTANEQRFAPKSKLWANHQPVTAANSRSAAGHLYVTLKGYPDRSSVDRFRGALLQVPESMLLHL